LQLKIYVCNLSDVGWMIVIPQRLRSSIADQVKFREFMYLEYQNCSLCPRNCQIDRYSGKKGYCGESAELRIASIEAHFGEEPPISGSNGSGTVFFSGCAMRCVFCQNYQISCFHMGEFTKETNVADRLELLYRTRDIHNVNFVTPDHFLPHTIQIVDELRQRHITLPILYNTSGYVKVSMIQRLADYADIYMPDYKYADSNLAYELSRCGDYPIVALDAIAEMVKQKGMLDSSLSGRTIATQGVLVRHLVLPGQAQNSIEALSVLYGEFGVDLPISLMSQYWPARMVANAEMNRRVSSEEFYRVYEHSRMLGFRNMFVQHLPPGDEHADDFLPDFRLERPFKGNRGKKR
jgi:putative pyruvate formate lyase activating enzyme